MQQKTRLFSRVAMMLLMMLLTATNDVAALATRLGGKQTNVVLSGRKLWKDGAWNTLVLPFTIANIDADGCPLKGATVRQLSEAYVTGTTLTLNFDDPTTAIAAGTPYIVKWDGGTEGEYTQDPVFQGVTIDATTHSYDNQAGGDTNVRFIGTYDQKTVNTEDQSILFLGAANTLYYPSGQSATTIGACRAYFKIGSGDALARQLTVFNFGFADETGIGHTEITEITERADAWYTLDGVKVNGKPTCKGLYIHGGKKVVIK